MLDQISSILNTIPIDFGGGCNLPTAYVIAKLIETYKCDISIDIGVYKGRSLFPQAVAHKLVGTGIVYGVDPWNAEEAMEYDTHMANTIKEFNSNIDYNKIYNEVLENITKFGLEDNVYIIREKSQNAAIYFENKNIIPSFVRIDGNHDVTKALDDAILYSSMLRSPGIVMLDDISWSSVTPAFIELSNRLSLAFVDDYALFCKGIDYKKLYNNMKEWENEYLIWKRGQ
jgi:hypothetical protein